MDNNNSNIVLRETGVAITKGLIGAIPYVGPLLNESVFEARGRIKQHRINTFINELIKYMENITEEEIKVDHIKSEAFGDVFESIIMRVLQNNSEEKLHRFKKVLVKQMVNPYDTDYTETFLDIIARINEKQISILDVHRKIKLGTIELNENIPGRGTLDANQEIKLSEYRKPAFFDLDNDTYQFYVQDLISKALLMDAGINRGGASPYEILQITKFGVEFLNFIEER